LAPPRPGITADRRGIYLPGFDLGFKL